MTSQHQTARKPIQQISDRNRLNNKLIFASPVKLIMTKQDKTIDNARRVIVHQTMDKCTAIIERQTMEKNRQKRAQKTTEDTSESGSAATT